MPVVRRTRTRANAGNVGTQSGANLAHFTVPNPFPQVPLYGGATDPGPLPEVQAGGYVHGVAFWPGVVSPVACTYTCSHGVMPGVAQLTCLPQDTPIATHGNLVLYDGNAYVVIPAARLQDHKITKDSQGTLWHLEIVDRRWRWRDTGVINGCYNQRGKRGYYIPWTVRFPTELFAYCLDAMGEQNYEVLIPGQNVLPAINWDHINPAKALEDMAERLGCRVVYRLDTDTVAVVPVGVGVNALPAGFIFKEGPSQSTPDLPDTILLIGSPIRHQAQFRLTAVGEEWDGKPREINQLSYRPKGDTKPHIVHVVTLGLSKNFVYFVQINERAKATYSPPGPADPTAADVVGNLANAITNGAGRAPFGITVTAVFANLSGQWTLVLTGPESGETFDVRVGADLKAGLDPAAQTVWGDLSTFVFQKGDSVGEPWSKGSVPGFQNVEPTDRLSKADAHRLASGSVFRWYAICNLDIETGKYPATLPGFGKLNRIFQLIPENTKVEDVVPEEGDETALSFIDSQPIIDHFYDGFAREKPAEVYGIHWRQTTGYMTPRTDGNTREDAKVYVGFDIDHKDMLVKFHDYVYRLDEGRYRPATIRLETSFQVRHPVTNQVVRYIYAYTPDGPKAGTGPACFRHDDVFNWKVSIYTKSGRTQVLLLEANQTRLTIAGLIQRSQAQLDLVKGYLETALAQWGICRDNDDGGATAGHAIACGKAASDAADFARTACRRYDTAISTTGRPITADLNSDKCKNAKKEAQDYVTEGDARRTNATNSQTTAHTERDAVLADLSAPPVLQAAVVAAANACDNAVNCAAASVVLANAAVNAIGGLLTKVEELEAAVRGTPEGAARLLRTYDNDEQSAALARYYLLFHLYNYQIRRQLHRGYLGLVPIACDGSIHQVTWSVGPQGTFTEASLHGEHSGYVPSLPERRKFAYLSAVERAQNPLVSGVQVVSPAAFAAATFDGRPMT